MSCIQTRNQHVTQIQSARYVSAKQSDTPTVLSAVYEPVYAYIYIDIRTSSGGRLGNVPFGNISGLFQLIDYLNSFPPPPPPHSSFILSSWMLYAESSGCGQAQAPRRWGEWWGGLPPRPFRTKGGSWRPHFHNGGWPGQQLAAALLQPAPCVKALALVIAVSYHSSSSPRVCRTGLYNLWPAGSRALGYKGLRVTDFQLMVNRGFLG